MKIEHLEGTALELKDGVKEVSKKVDALKDWIRAVLLLVVVELAAVAFKGLKG